MQVQRKMPAARKLSSLHFCLFTLHWEASPGRKLTVLTPCASCKHLSIVYLQTAHQPNAGLAAKTPFRTLCPKWTNKANCTSKSAAEHSFIFTSHITRLWREITDVLRNTYQVFGSWDGGAQRGLWDDEEAFLCCWGGCLSWLLIRLFFYGTNNKL